VVTQNEAGAISIWMTAGKKVRMLRMKLLVVRKNAQKSEILTVSSSSLMVCSSLLAVSSYC
jgi:hypothetical protein